MLSDFLAVEIYFGSPNAALYFEDLAKRYGEKRLQRAIERGDLQCRRSCFGRGRVLTWLSEQGRAKASPEFS